MNWNEILISIIEVVVSLTVAYAIPYCLSLISKNTKNSQNEKYLSFAAQVVTDCVLTVKQVYVDDLKANGEFTAEAKVRAYEMCKNQILAMLNEKTKEAIMLAYGDLEMYIKTAIESSVVSTKSK